MVQLLCALDKGIELDKGIWAEGGREVLRGGIGGGEFRSQIIEISECELAGIGAVADAEEADVILDRVATIISVMPPVDSSHCIHSLEIVLARFDAGLRRSVAIQSAEDHLGLTLDLSQLRLSLNLLVSLSSSPSTSVLSLTCSSSTEAASIRPVCS